MGVYKVGVPFNQLCSCEQEVLSDVPEYKDICELLDTRKDAHIGCSSWYFTRKHRTIIPKGFDKYKIGEPLL